VAEGIRIEGLRKRFGRGDAAVDALKGVEMVVARRGGGLVGPSDRARARC